jgi:hypothetical protein
MYIKKCILAIILFMSMPVLIAAQEKAMVFHRNNGKAVAIRNSEIDSIVFTLETSVIKKSYWSDEVTIAVNDTTDLNFPKDIVPVAYIGDHIALEGASKYAYEVYSDNSYSHQSSAAYGKYLFLVKDKLATVYMYNLQTKRVVAICNMTTHNETVSASSSSVLYHCNQSTFGTFKYDESDPFPLLYISQRAPSSTGRCFVTVFRLLPTMNSAGTEYNILKMEQVQTIYLPKSTFSNAMGNANFTIDPQTGYCYTYSRNNTTSASNYLNCRISKFAPVKLSAEEVYLNDADILDSYEIFELNSTKNISAMNMQGGFIWNNKLYISQGYPSCNFIYLRIVDLKNRKLINDIDLLGDGFPIEPEGFFRYGNDVMMSCNGSPIYKFYFE